MFSSSFSEQSATGKPWVAAESAHGCDEPYNSFVAMYRVEGEETLIALGPIPYGTLSEGHLPYRGLEGALFHGAPTGVTSARGAGRPSGSPMHRCRRESSQAQPRDTAQGAAANAVPCMQGRLSYAWMPLALIGFSYEQGSRAGPRKGLGHRIYSIGGRSESEHAGLPGAGFESG